MKAQQLEVRSLVPVRSAFGLNAANFFQAEMVGVILPVLNAFLREAHWRYDSIGIATAAAGFGTLICQAPAGRLTDKLSCRRLLFVVVAVPRAYVSSPCRWFRRLGYYGHAAVLVRRGAKLFRAAAGRTGNAPILPTVALYVKKLGGSDTLVTATVLTAQIVMVPVAIFAGPFCDSAGRKPVMAVAFWALPIRIFAYTLVHNPKALVYVQALDGIGAGIYGVAIVVISADLTRGKGGFSTLTGLFATALATAAC